MQRKPFTLERIQNIRLALKEYYKTHPGHNNRMGKKNTEEHNNIIRLANTGANNHNWKGDAVKYQGVHSYVRKHYPKPNKCEICQEIKPLEISNISGLYKRDFSDWEWICRKCHMKKDGRLKKNRNHMIMRNKKAKW